MSLFGDIRKELQATYRYRYVVYAYTQNMLKLRYRRSALGFVWTVLAPMLNFLVIGLVFGLLFINRIPNFFQYYFAGAVFFSVITASLGRAPVTFIQNEAFIKKIYVPKMVFVLSGITYEVANFTLSLLALLVLGFSLRMITVSWHMVFSVLAVLLITLFLVGLGSIISVITVYFRDFINIVPVVLQAAFFVTPVIYSREMIPPKYIGLISYNPLYYYVELFRRPIVDHVVPPASFVGIASALSVTSLLLGVLILKKYDNRIVFKL